MGIVAELFFHRFFKLISTILFVMAMVGSVAPAAIAGSGGTDDARAVVAFVPVDHPGDLKLLRQARTLGGFAVGLASPSLGRDVPAVQTYLDFGQGSRVDYSLYGSLPRNAARFVRLGGGIRSVAFKELRKRAADVPATIEPGLLATTLEQSGIEVAYAYSPEAINDLPGIPQALAAMDGRGVVRKVGRINEIQSLLRRNRAVISWLPADLVQDLAKRLGENDLLVLLGAPRARSNDNHMLPVAVRGLRSQGTLSSDTTRTDGLVTVPDITASVVNRFGIDSPDGFQGSPFRLGPARSIGTLEKLDNRLSVIEARRLPALAVMAGAILLIIALLSLALGRRGLWLGIRISALGLFWLPLVLLLVAALNLPAGWEYALNVCVALVLSIVSALLLPVRVAPIVAIGTSLAAIVIDLALGSQLIQISLLGSNPAYGARFYGIGNELEGLLAVSFLLGAGLAVDLVGVRSRSLALLIAGAVLAFILGWTELGADIGGVIVVGVGSVVAATLVARRRPTSARVLLSFAGVAAVLAVVIVADLISGGSHLTELFSGSGGTGGIGDTIARRVELSYKSLTQPETLVFSVVALGLLAAGLKKRRMLLAPLAGDRWRGARAGVVAALTATIIGFLINDSGPLLLIGGTVEIVFFLGYVWATTNQWNQETGLRAS